MYRILFYAGSALVITATLGLCTLPATAQNAPKPFDPDKAQPESWMSLPEIIPFANADGSIDVAWRDYSAQPPKIYLTRFSKTADGYARSAADELPSLGSLAGFTKDDKGNVYYMTAEPGKGEERKRIVLYKNKQVFWNFMMQDGDNPAELPKLPMDNGTSQIVTGAGKLFVDINLMPAHAYNVLLDIDSPAVNATRTARETLWHHNMDQRVLFDGQDFLAIENRDHEVTLSMMKFSPVEPYPFQPYAERLRSVYTRTNNGNSIFTELGDIAPGLDNGNGYLVLFASERDWDNQMEGLNKPGEQTGLGGQLAPRDLAVIHVKKDFDRQEVNWKSLPAEQAADGNIISQAPKLVDTTGVVNSTGTSKTTTYKAKNDGWDWPNYNADTAKLVASGQLAERSRKTTGVNWLTSYGVPFETARQLPAVGKPYTTVVHPKLVRLTANNYIAIWEEHTGARATWSNTASDLTYATTKAMRLTLAAEGTNVRITPGPIKDLGKIRVMAFDDAITLDGKAAWVTGDEANKALRLNILDADLNLKTVSLPLSGAVTGLDLRAGQTGGTAQPVNVAQPVAQPLPPVVAQPNPPAVNPQPAPQPAPQPVPPVVPNAPFAPVTLDSVTIDFATNWTTTRNDKDKLITSVCPDGTARLLLKFTKYRQYDPLQENMVKEIFPPLFPGLKDVNEVDTQHDVFHGGLGLRIVTYTATWNGKPVNITAEFAKPPTEDDAPTVLLIHCVQQGVTKYDAAIAKISKSLRRAAK